MNMPAVAPILELKHSAASLPFEIHSMDWIGQNRWEQNAIPHRHNYFSIIWVKQATGKHLVDLDEFILEPDTVFCITPGQIHLMQADLPADGYVISFTADFMDPGKANADLLFNTGLFYTFSHSPMIKVAAELREEMEDMVQRMMKEYGNFFLLRAEILRGFLKIFLIYLTRQYQQSETTEALSRGSELVTQFFSLLDKKYIDLKMVAGYAAELAVTPNHLNEVVKKTTGFPASHHIQQRIVMEAKRKAAYSDQSMKQIAYDLGFDDTAHFSKFFRNASGENFTEFRKNLKIHTGET